MPMNPLLICSYRPRYLGAVLEQLIAKKAPDRYRIMVWDNGGAAPICARFHVECCAKKAPLTERPLNIGKAAGVEQLINTLLREQAEFDCYVCMDDDILVDTDHLDALVSTALRQGMGMIGGHYHPFNAPVSSKGSFLDLEPCPSCARNHTLERDGCHHCQGQNKDVDGLCLKVYPAEYRTEKHWGMVAGGLFAIARKTVERLPWAPYLYPVLYRDRDPVVYWPEDAELDCVLTALGFTNGYLESSSVTPAIHLPELDENYQRWKQETRRRRLDTSAYPRN